MPNATLTIVENADRFGLAQLGISCGDGRSGRQTVLLRVADGQSGSRDNLARLTVLHNSNDGFELAQRDLEPCGRGAAVRPRQHGLPDLRPWLIY